MCVEGTYLTRTNNFLKNSKHCRVRIRMKTLYGRQRPYSTLSAWRCLGNMIPRQRRKVFKGTGRGNATHASGGHTTRVLVTLDLLRERSSSKKKRGFHSKSSSPPSPHPHPVGLPWHVDDNVIPRNARREERFDEIARVPLDVFLSDVIRSITRPLVPLACGHAARLRGRTSVNCVPTGMADSGREELRRAG